MSGIWRSSRTLAAATLLALAVTACGGGSGSSSLPTAGIVAPSQPAPSAPSNANVKMVVNIPPKSAASSMRNPKYISASTKSMTIGILSGGKTTQVAEADLTPTSPNCSVVTGGVTQCNVAFLGAAGSNTFVLTMYDATGGKGNVLSIGDVNATLVAGQNTTVAVDLDGVPANLSVIVGAATSPVGTASSTAVYVQATDADGNLIIGPGGFATPISLAVTGDTYDTLALSTNTVTSPGQVVSLAYTGATNVGSQITASMTGVSSASATFAGSGASITYFGFTDNTDNLSYVYSYAIQPLPGTSPTVAVLMQGQQCCTTYVGMIGVANPNGVQKVYSGDVTDPFNMPAPGSLTYANVTVIHGMSKQLQTWTGEEASKEIAATSAGNVYYAGAVSTSSDSTNCPAQSETTGTIGLLNPTSGALVQPEKLLKGNPMYLQIDPAGNLWFLESSGSCNGSNILPSGWGVGELSANGTLTETDSGSIGLSAIWPDSMQLSNDGTSMYVGDNNSGNLVQVMLNSSAIVGTATLTSSSYPSAIAVAPAPDNTVAWASDFQTGEFYGYGWLDGGTISGTVNQAQFPTADFYSAGMTYADGNFWTGGDAWSNGIARMSGWASGKPLVTQYPMVFGDDNPELTGVSASNGYIWAGDDEYGYIIAMQYGVQPTNGTVTLAMHRIGPARAQRNANPGPKHPRAQHTTR
jgi:hypothetical protein